MKTTAKIVGVDARFPDAPSIVRTAAMIRQGAVVVFPTSGLYGLGADAFRFDAVERIFRIKARDPRNPLLVLIDHIAMLDRVALPVTAMARALMTYFWPGQVTFVVSAHPGLPPGLTAGSGKIGVRLAAHPVACALIGVLKSPLTGTSANLSGSGGCAAIAQLDRSVLDAVDVVLDAGPLLGGPGSTVVDVSGATPVILREGCVAADAVMACFQSFRAVDGRR